MSETKTKNLCTVPAADLTDSQYFIAEDGGELKRIPKAQVVLKKLENMLATDTENLAGGGEVTAQELLDALAEQVANKLLAKSQVVNNLLATVEGNPLDATQGKALKELIDTTNNNLSKYNFNLGDTTANNHKNIDRIETFSGGTWINKNYNADFGGQWCFVDSFLIDDNGPYAIQRIMSAQTNTVLATRYCEKNVWGDWNIGVTKSDLSDRAKKLSANFTPGNTVLDVSSWSVITLLSIVTYKEESTALYLLRKESSSKIYCIPVKSSTQVSVTYNGENKLILTNSATYGGTYTVLFLS